MLKLGYQWLGVDILDIYNVYTTPPRNWKNIFCIFSLNLFNNYAIFGYTCFPGSLVRPGVVLELSAYNVVFHGSPRDDARLVHEVDLEKCDVVARVRCIDFTHGPWEKLNDY